MPLSPSLAQLCSSMLALFSDTLSPSASARVKSQQVYTGTTQRCCRFDSRPPQPSKYCNKNRHSLFASGESCFQCVKTTHHLWSTINQSVIKWSMPGVDKQPGWKHKDFILLPSKSQKPLWLRLALPGPRVHLLPNHCPRWCHSHWSLFIESLIGRQGAKSSGSLRFTSY